MLAEDKLIANRPDGYSVPQYHGEVHLFDVGGTPYVTTDKPYMLFRTCFFKLLLLIWVHKSGAYVLPPHVMKNRAHLMMGNAHEGFRKITVTYCAGSGNIVCEDSTHPEVLEVRSGKRGTRDVIAGISWRAPPAPAGKYNATPEEIHAKGEIACLDKVRDAIWGHQKPGVEISGDTFAPKAKVDATPPSLKPKTSPLKPPSQAKNVTNVDGAPALSKKVGGKVRVVGRAGGGAPKRSSMFKMVKELTDTVKGLRDEIVLLKAKRNSSTSTSATSDSVSREQAKADSMSG
jgi:hypothetical protein